MSFVLAITQQHSLHEKTKAYIPLQRKTIRVGSWRWPGHPMPQSCVTYTNMLVSKNAKICFTPDAKPKICITPDAKPRRKSVEYRLRWVPNAKFSRWQCTFHLFGVDFICVWWPTQTQFPVEYGLTSRGIYLIKHANMFSICSWYLKAQQIAPKNGRPYNQLAILALYTVSTRISCV